MPRFQPPHSLSATLAALSLLAACGGDVERSDPATEDAPMTATGDPVPAQPGKEISGVDPDDAAGEAARTGEEAETTDPSEEMAGGEAHVHGRGEMSAAMEDNELTVTVTAALASFGLPEAEPEDEAAKSTMRKARMSLADPLKVVEIDPDARCVFAGSDMITRYSGDHGAVTLEYLFQCSNADAFDWIDVRLLEQYDTLEALDAILLADGEQTASTLTAAKTRLARE